MDCSVESRMPFPVGSPVASPYNTVLEVKLAIICKQKHNIITALRAGCILTKVSFDERLNK